MRLVRAARPGADRDDRRAGLSRERRPLDARLGKDERAGRHVDALAVELESRAPGMDEVNLLLLVVLLGLVVLVDDPVAGVFARPRVDAESLDAEVVPNRPPGSAAVADQIGRAHV